MSKRKIGNSTFRLLFIYRLLYQGGYTLDEIVQEFAFVNRVVEKKDILKDIEYLKEKGIEISTLKLGSTQSYRIPKQADNELKFSREELKILSDVKKLLVKRKNYVSIQKAMGLLYKVAFFVKDKEKREDIADFGYFSTLNWFLVTKLKQHCKNKDIILLDYIVPDGTNRYISFHADSLLIDSKSNRLYLKGINRNKNLNQFSSLPVDRIFMIKKVEQENIPFNMHLRVLNYTISRKLYEKIEPEKNEQVIKVERDLVTIQRPVDDEFKIIQKLLSYCPNVYEISDEKIKKQLVEKLEVLKANYEKKRR